ncbi:hypothetical protein M0812_14312 [Anaeramoeba flamelloides]|uniref:BTB domain-containing protein n=1 Tax=Anaeramoeba flamelloides TaxID=1746091 RepID=A0AAV7ZJY9_9EUKA|nr:hypothetical protein M0812_14312 [Anaeramoeba flamelloides]
MDNRQQLLNERHIETIIQDREFCYKLKMGNPEKVQLEYDNIKNWILGPSSTLTSIVHSNPSIFSVLFNDDYIELENNNFRRLYFDVLVAFLDEPIMKYLSDDFQNNPKESVLELFVEKINLTYSYDFLELLIMNDKNQTIFEMFLSEAVHTLLLRNLRKNNQQIFNPTYELLLNIFKKINENNNIQEIKKLKEKIPIYIKALQRIEKRDYKIYHLYSEYLFFYTYDHQTYPLIDELHYFFELPQYSHLRTFYVKNIIQLIQTSKRYNTDDKNKAQLIKKIKDFWKKKEKFNSINLMHILEIVEQLNEKDQTIKKIQEYIQKSNKLTEKQIKLFGTMEEQMKDIY